MPGSTLPMEEAFARGDYMGVSLRAEPSQWQYHASRGLIADPVGGIEGLARFDHTDARFYSAVLSWMAGDEDTTCRALEQIPTPHAQNLLALIRRPRLRVLSMLPPVRHGAFVLRDGIRHDPKFDVANIGFYPDDVPERPYASVFDYVPSRDWADLFVAQVIEWHQIPVDLQQLPCPTVGFTNDFDLHIQGLRQWFDPFDVRVVIDHVYEWPTLDRISGEPTLSFPLVFGVSGNLPRLEGVERDIDVLFSGTLVSSYNPEKEQLIRDLLQVPDLKMVLIDGHVSDAAYFQLLGRAKITPSFCRHRGGIQTRVMESLSMGSISIVQPDSIMKLWAGPETGLWEYDEALGPVPQIRQILADYNRYAEGCVAHAPAFRSAFEGRTIASRLFRFCVFAAARPGRHRAAIESLTQKRVMFAHGPSRSHSYAMELAQMNASRMAVHRAERVSAGLDEAREWLMVYARALYDNQYRDLDSGHLERAIRGYRDAVSAFPKSLVAKFNLFRVLLHFGGADRHGEAVTLLDEIVESRADWEIDPADDVLPYDFMPEWFNYRSYLDLVVDAHATGEPQRARMCDLLVAAAFHYRAVRDRSVSDADTSVQLDPAFTPYRLTLAELLAGREDAASCARAVEFLADLAKGSNVALRAGRLLQAIAERGTPVPATLVDEAATIEERIRLSLIQTEHHHLKVTSPYFVSERVREAWRHGEVMHRRRESADPVFLSLIVGGYHGRQCESLLRELCTQTIPRSLYEIIYIDCYGEPTFDADVDIVVSLNQRELLDCIGRAWLVGLELARSPVSAIVVPGSHVGDRFAETLVDAFYRRPLGSTPFDAPRSVSVRSAAASERQACPQFAAFRFRDCVRAGGIDEAEMFRSDGSALSHLIDRLALIGVPRLALENERLVPVEGGRWWNYDRRLEASGRMAAAKVIWPHMFEGNKDLLRKLQMATLAHSGATANVVRVGGGYVVAPFAVGAVDWKALALNDELPLRVCRSLDEAKEYAGF